MEKKILDYLSQVKPEDKAVLCSIIYQSGSTPRKDFPVMIVTASGNAIGTIGGGNLEYNVIRTAAQVKSEGKPLLLRHVMKGKDVLGDSGICGGEVSVFMEPFNNEHHRIFSEARQRYQQESIWINTIVRDGEFSPQSSWKIVDIGITENPKEKVKDPYKLTSYSERHAGTIEIHRFIHTAPRLHIFGAGHVGSALAELAHFLDYSVLVYDDRPELLTKNRFPHSDDLRLGQIADLLLDIKILPMDAIIVTTRNHAQDLEIMRHMMTVNAGYLGLVSSRRKWVLIRKALVTEGYPEEHLSSVYAPTGLDIGADTVPEIAISILSEIINTKKHHSQSPISLRHIRQKGAGK